MKRSAELCSDPQQSPLIRVFPHSGVTAAASEEWARRVLAGLASCLGEAIQHRALRSGAWKPHTRSWCLQSCQSLASPCAAGAWSEWEKMNVCPSLPSPARTPASWTMVQLRFKCPPQKWSWEKWRRDIHCPLAPSADWNVQGDTMYTLVSRPVKSWWALPQAVSSIPCGWLILSEVSSASNVWSHRQLG